MRVIVSEGKLKGCEAVIGRTIRGVTYSEKEGAGWFFKPLTMAEYSQYRKDKAEGKIDSSIGFAFDPDDIWRAIETCNEPTLDEERTFSQIQALMKR